MTPEFLRLGLPLDQSRHDEGRKILLTERKKEYNEMLAKVLQWSLVKGCASLWLFSFSVIYLRNKVSLMSYFLLSLRSFM